MKKSNRLFPVILAATLCLGAMTGCHKQEPASTEPPAAATEIKRDPFSPMESTVLYDANSIKITAHSMEQTNLGGEIKVSLENNSSDSVSFVANDLIVNGLTFNDGFSISANPGKTVEGTIKISYRSLDAAKMVDIATVKSPDAQIIKNNDFTALYDAPFEIKSSIADKYETVITNQGTVLYEENGLRIAALEIHPNQRTSTVRILATNAGAEPIMLKGKNFKANGNDVSAWVFDTVYPGTSRYCEFELAGADITEVNLDIDVYSAGAAPALLYETGSHAITRA